MPKKHEYRCLTDGCEIYSNDQIAQGECPYVKYSRGKAKSKEYTHHDYANNYHYHYKCVLESVSKEMKNRIIESKDEIAIKTHFPYDFVLEVLMK